MPASFPYGTNLSGYNRGLLAPQPQAPSPGNLLMAAAIQSQDPAYSMPEGQDRPRLPGRRITKKTLSPLGKK